MQKWLTSTAAGALFIIDRLLKSIALSLPPPRSLGEGLFVRSLNRGIAFSLPVPPWLLAALLAAGCVTVAALFFKEVKKGTAHAPLYMLIIAGAVSNIIDRIRVGAVIDYFSISLIGLNFNLADCMVVAGVGIIVAKNLKSRMQ